MQLKIDVLSCTSARWEQTFHKATLVGLNCFFYEKDDDFQYYNIIFTYPFPFSLNVNVAAVFELKY